MRGTWPTLVLNPLSGRCSFDLSDTFNLQPAPTNKPVDMQPAFGTFIGGNVWKASGEEER